MDNKCGSTLKCVPTLIMEAITSLFLWEWHILEDAVNGNKCQSLDMDYTSFLCF